MYNIIMAVWVLEYMSDITNQKALLYFSSEKKAVQHHSINFAGFLIDSQIFGFATNSLL